MYFLNLLDMKKLLSLPPNAVKNYHGLNNRSEEEWFCTSTRKRNGWDRERNDLAAGGVLQKRSQGNGL